MVKRRFMLSDALRSLLSHDHGPTMRRYYLLDGFRGIAALAVMLYHYKIFIDPFHIPGTKPGGLEPFRWALGLIYDQGSMAVPIFWMISGFVFAAVYAGASGTGRSFAINRFARLYPLHLLTLIVVALLQMVPTAQFGRWFIYTNNDPYHFMLQLFFVQLGSGSGLLVQWADLVGVRWRYSSISPSGCATGACWSAA